MTPLLPPSWNMRMTQRSHWQRFLCKMEFCCVICVGCPSAYSPLGTFRAKQRRRARRNGCFRRLPSAFSLSWEYQAASRQRIWEVCRPCSWRYSKKSVGCLLTVTWAQARYWFKKKTPPLLTIRSGFWTYTPIGWFSAVLLILCFPSFCLFVFFFVCSFK